MAEKQSTGVHKLILESRKAGTITGVNDVISFDPKLVIIDTQLGIMNIKGKELHVASLSLEKGEITFDGLVDSIVYLDNRRTSNKSESFINRMFK